MPRALILLIAACSTTSEPAPAQPTRTGVARTIFVMSEPGMPPWPPLISGTSAILPEVDTIERARAEYAVLRGMWKVCIDETGAVVLVDTLSSSGFTEYDAKIRREVSKWRYRPYVIEGKPTAACKAISFVYELPP